jgi:hypothetical protein
MSRIHCSSLNKDIELFHLKVRSKILSPHESVEGNNLWRWPLVRVQILWLGCRGIQSLVTVQFLWLVMRSTECPPVWKEGALKNIKDIRYSLDINLSYITHKGITKPMFLTDIHYHMDTEGLTVVLTEDNDESHLNCLNLSSGDESPWTGASRVLVVHWHRFTVCRQASVLL